MEAIVTLIMPLIAIALFGLAAIHFGVDTRDPMTDDHRR